MPTIVGTILVEVGVGEVGGLALLRRRLDELEQRGVDDHFVDFVEAEWLLLPTVFSSA